MGTMIQRLRLTEADFRGERFARHRASSRATATSSSLDAARRHPRHPRQYLEAGADIIETNTFSSPAISQADYGLERSVYELNVAGARLARAGVRRVDGEDARQPRFVAGSIGPTNRTLSISPDVNNPAFRAVTFDQVRDAYASRSAASSTAAPTCCSLRPSSTR